MYFQVSAIITVNFAMLLYLILVFPYESKHENIKTCAGEIVIIGICIAGLFLVNDEEAQIEEKRMNVGWWIVGLSAFILFWHTIQLLFETLKSLW